MMLNNVRDNIKIGFCPISAEEEEVRYAECVEIRRLYGKNLHEYLMRRRTHNVSWTCTKMLKGISYDDLEKMWKRKFNDDVWEYAKIFGIQLEQCVANSVVFRKNLHKFYVRTSEEIMRNNKIGEFAEFMHILFEEAIRNKMGIDEAMDRDLERIFSAYLSLVEQCYTYFVKGSERCVLGLKSDKSDIITGEDIYPYIDNFQYLEEDVLHEYMMACERKGGASRTLLAKVDKAYDRIRERFEGIGFGFKNGFELEAIVGCSNNYSNNLYSMAYYLDENTLDFIPKARGAGASFVEDGCVRQWQTSDFYKNELKIRNYTLPSDGVIAEFAFAGAIKKLYLKEVLKDEKVILLWKVVYETNLSVSDGIAETTGYYDPQAMLFFSNFILGSTADGTKEIELMKNRDTLENFVLENYYLLTKKEKANEKKYSIMIINSDNKPIDKIPRWKNQPIVNYVFKTVSHGENTTGRKNGKSGEYFMETISLSCIVRKLPDGWSASEEARENAVKYGYDLEDGYTFVLPFKRQQRRLKGNGIIRR